MCEDEDMRDLKIGGRGGPAEEATIRLRSSIETTLPLSYYTDQRTPVKQIAGPDFRKAETPTRYPCCGNEEMKCHRARRVAEDFGEDDQRQ